MSFVPVLEVLQSMLDGKTVEREVLLRALVVATRANAYLERGMVFFLDEAQVSKARAFVKEQDSRAFVRQVAACEECKQAGVEKCHRHRTGHPYYGAIGGADTYTFTSTSLGTIAKIKRGDAECDLSDYGDW